MLRFLQRFKVVNRTQKRRTVGRIEKPEERKINAKIIFQSIFNYVKVYFKYSSMHGLKYLVKNDTGWLQRVMWLSVLILCHVCCFLIGFESVERFRFKSIVMGVERDYHYWNTSVPSFTVCSMERIDVKRFENFCSSKNIIDEYEREEFFAFLESLANATYFNFQNIHGGSIVDNVLKRLNILPENYMELIYNLTANFIFLTDEHQISSTNGREDVFSRQVLTEYGICYVTNSALGPEYSTEYALFGKFPQLSSNASNAKQIVKGTYFESDVLINFLGFPLKGIDSYIHSIHEVMRVDHNTGFLLDSLMFEAFPLEIIVDENFEHHVSIEQRKCRFQHESNLTHFPLYTKNLCLQECRLNMAMEKCNCIPHFYPNRIPNPKPVCHYKTLVKCFPDLELNLLQLYRTVEGKKVPVECYCLENCEDTIVTVENVRILEGTKVLYGNSIGVHVMVENWPKQRFKRQVVYSFTDLMVSFGSTAGLFLGFNVLGGIEFIYFFTIRLFFHMCGIKIE